MILQGNYVQIVSSFVSVHVEAAQVELSWVDLSLSYTEDDHDLNHSQIKRVHLRITYTYTPMFV
jgi:hypothetical protein